MYTRGFEALGPPCELKPPEHKTSNVNHRYLCFSNEKTFIYADISTTSNVLFCTDRPGSQSQSSLKSSDLNSSAVETPHQQLKDGPGSVAQWQNKVPISTQTRPGQPPFKLVLERLRRQFFKVDLEKLLTEKGIDTNMLKPRCVKSCDEHVTTAPDYLLPPYFPLEMFDDEECDCRTPKDWLVLCSAEQSPISAKALLPKDDETPDASRSLYLEYGWHFVGVLDYSKEMRQYLVQKIHQVWKQQHEKGTPINVEHRKKVKSFERGTKHWVPRIRLLFSLEDPHAFAERIDLALQLRKDTETRLLHSLSVDCMPIWEGTPSLSDDSLQRIKRLVLPPPGLKQKTMEKCGSYWEKEVKLEYARVMNRFTFDHQVMTHPKEFSHITLPLREHKHVPEKGCVPVPDFSFTSTVAEFKRRSFLVKPEVVSVFTENLTECIKVKAMKLFNLTMDKPCRLDEFEDIQSEIHTQTIFYLQNNWISSLCNSIVSKRIFVEQYDYKAEESCFTNYKYSKLFKMIKLINVNICRSLWCLVKESLISLNEVLLEACHGVVTCPQDLVWGNDLITSPYMPKKLPIFLVDLVLDQTGVHYSTPLEDFEASVIKLFDNAVQATWKVPQLEKFLMKKMVMPENLVIMVDLNEPEVSELREKIRSALVQATIPLRAYAAEYEKHLDLHNLEIEAFLVSQSADLTAQEVKKEVEEQLKEKEKLNRSLPSSIVIGPFFVSVENARQSLTQKREALADALLEHLAVRLRKELDNACEKCEIIIRRLHEKPSSIENLTEQRQWMKQIPEQLKQYKQGVLNKILSDYELIEEFCHCLSCDDFNKKWTAILWPQRIISQMETVTLQQEKDEEYFRNIQLSDHNNFEKQLDSLQRLHVEFAEYLNINHADVIVKKVQRIKQQLKECQTLARTFNTREHLLSLPVSNYDRLQKIVKQFQPYEELWTTTSDWLCWNKRWLGDPLTSINPEQVESLMTSASETINKCVTQFEDLPDMQMLAATVQRKIEDFRPSFLLIQCLKNPGMESHHWKMISDSINIQVRPNDNWSLTHYLDLGLQNHLDEIIPVCQMAAKEYSIEQGTIK